MAATDKPFIVYILKKMFNVIMHEDVGQQC